MKDDIELTRMNNAFKEIMLTIQPMLKKCMETAGENCTVIVMRHLAVELTARYLIAIKVKVEDAKKEEVINDFLDSTFIRVGELLEQAINLGLMERKK